MRSEGKNETDLPYIEVEPTEDERQKMEQNYEMYVNKGQIEFITPEHILKEQKRLNIEQLKEDLKVAKTNDDLKKIVQSLLDNQ